MLALPSALKNYIIVGNGAVQAGLAVVNGGLCVDNDGWCTASTTGRISSITSTIGATDLAEIYLSDDDLKPGEVVTVTSPVNYVTRADRSKADKPLGIVATDPGLLLGLSPGDDVGGNKYPISLAGRVPMWVTGENGPIGPGDYLTLSTMPGMGTKALKAGPVVRYRSPANVLPSVCRTPFDITSHNGLPVRS